MRLVCVWLVGDWEVIDSYYYFLYPGHAQHDLMSLTFYFVIRRLANDCSIFYTIWDSKFNIFKLKSSIFTVCQITKCPAPSHSRGSELCWKFYIFAVCQIMKRNAGARLYDTVWDMIRVRGHRFEVSWQDLSRSLYMSRSRRVASPNISRTACCSRRHELRSGEYTAAWQWASYIVISNKLYISVHDCPCTICISLFCTSTVPFAQGRSVLAEDLSDFAEGASSLGLKPRLAAGWRRVEI